MLVNGPEHFAEAQRLLALVERSAGEPDGLPTSQANYCMARAQVHATLALAAATVQDKIDAYTGSDEDVQGWAEVTAPASGGES